jgi:hypothetical protein
MNREIKLKALKLDLPSDVNDKAMGLKGLWICRLLPKDTISTSRLGGGVRFDYFKFIVPLGTTCHIRQRNFKG